VFVEVVIVAPIQGERRQLARTAAVRFLTVNYYDYDYDYGTSGRRGTSQKWRTSLPARSMLSDARELSPCWSSNCVLLPARSGVNGELCVRRNHRRTRVLIFTTRLPFPPRR